MSVWQHLCLCRPAWIPKIAFTIFVLILFLDFVLTRFIWLKILSTSSFDSNGTAISGCLGQVHEGILPPWLYISTKLNTAVRNYLAVKLEALATIFDITKLKKYLLGRQFVIQNDNQPLKVKHQESPKNARNARWALILEGYKFIVTDIAGSKNCLAHSLLKLWECLKLFNEMVVYL